MRTIRTLGTSIALATLLCGAGPARAAGSLSAGDGAAARPVASPTIQLAPTSRVSPGADAQVERLGEVRLPLTGTRVQRVHQLRLTRGTIEIEVERDANDSFDVRLEGDRLVEVRATDVAGPVLVRSPAGDVAIVVDGRATVVVRDGQLSVVNRRGQTLVGSSRSVVRLPEGHARSACSGKAIRPLPAAPTMAAGQRVWMAVGDGTVQPSSLQWTASRGADRYQVELRRVDEPSDPVRFEAEAPALGNHAPPLTPGRYELRVRALDECGLAGEPSEPEPFRVVGVGLPRGAYAQEDGTILLPEDSSVRLLHADGLLLRSSAGGLWSAAPASLALVGSKERSVLIGLPGISTDTLRLAPRDVQAKVQLGPQDVRWPGQDVEVEVKLGRANGQPVPAWLEPTAKVTVGVKQVFVKWEREGDTLRATVPPQPGQGPCVVRVVVSDQFGLPLGRGFVEVARQPG